MMNNLFAPLSTYGGYDLFVFVPGHPAGSANRSSTDTSAYNALRPGTINAHGERDRMFLRVGGEESLLPCDATESRWKNYYYSAKQTSRGSWLARVQSVLRQLHDMSACHQMIAQREAAANVQYAYKMRLRTDLAFLRPIPPPHQLDLGSATHPRLVGISRSTLPSYFDKFAIGLSTPMGCFLDRFDAIYKYEFLDRTWAWTNEMFVQHWCNETQRATIVEDDRIQAVLFRTVGYNRASRNGGAANERQPVGADGCMCSRYRGSNGSCKQCAQEGKANRCFLACCPCTPQNATGHAAGGVHRTP